MRIRLARFLALALVLACLFGAAACGNQVPGKTDETKTGETGSGPAQETETAASGIRWLDDTGGVRFQCIRPDACSDKLTKAALTVVKAVRDNLGVTQYQLKTDFVKFDEEVPSGEGELLIGPTNRKVTERILGELGEDEYRIVYTDGAIVIAGQSERATLLAIETFIRTCLPGEGVNPELCLDEHLDIKGKYEVKQIVNVADTPLPCADYRASSIFLLSAPSGADAITLATLQGLCAAHTSEQILIQAGSLSAFLPYIEAEGVIVSQKDEKGSSWTLNSLLDYFKSVLKGYILFDDSTSAESASVAISLSGVLQAVAVPSSKEGTVKNLGLECLLDVRGKGDAWLRSSEYFSRLSREVAVEQPSTMAPRLVDYAAMAGCYFRFYDGTDGNEHARVFDFLDDNAVVVGWNNTLGEFSTVASLSEVNLSLIPADHATNLSTLSGFATDSMTAPNTETSGQVKNRHTVTILMSDGDNVQWLLNNFLTNSSYYGSSYRGSLEMNWGVPCAGASITSPAIRYMYDKATRQDHFVAQLSGTGYTFPSKWSDKAREDLAYTTAESMERLGVSVLEVLDDHGFKAEYFEDFMYQDAISGALYIDYSDYSGEDGKIMFINGKPVVAARYKLWNGFKDGTPQAIAQKILRASTDPTSANAYSFIIVHAWSGLGQDGELQEGGNCMAGVDALVSALGDKVDIVSVDEFIARITTNVRH